MKEVTVLFVILIVGLNAINLDYINRKNSNHGLINKNKKYEILKLNRVERKAEANPNRKNVKKLNNFDPII